MSEREVKRQRADSSVDTMDVDDGDNGLLDLDSYLLDVEGGPPSLAIAAHERVEAARSASRDAKERAREAVDELVQKAALTATSGSKKRKARPKVPAKLKKEVDAAARSVKEAESALRLCSWIGKRVYVREPAHRGRVISAGIAPAFPAPDHPRSKPLKNVEVVLVDFDIGEIKWTLKRRCHQLSVKEPSDDSSSEDDAGSLSDNDESSSTFASASAAAVTENSPSSVPTPPQPASREFVDPYEEALATGSGFWDSLLASDWSNRPTFVRVLNTFAKIAHSWECSSKSIPCHFVDNGTPHNHGEFGLVPPPIGTAQLLDVVQALAKPNQGARTLDPGRFAPHAPPPLAFMDITNCRHGQHFGVAARFWNVIARNCCDSQELARTVIDVAVRLLRKVTEMGPHAAFVLERADFADRNYFYELETPDYYGSSEKRFSTFNAVSLGQLGLELLSLAVMHEQFVNGARNWQDLERRWFTTRIPEDTTTTATTITAVPPRAQVVDSWEDLCEVVENFSNLLRVGQAGFAFMTLGQSAAWSNARGQDFRYSCKDTVNQAPWALLRVVWLCFAFRSESIPWCPWAPSSEERNLGWRGSSLLPDWLKLVLRLGSSGYPQIPMDWSTMGLKSRFNVFY